ncbi:unnamed protein product [Phytophthora lilii]|uniref:Unnamed protein product n=1 Tax=Phytophthora lilii TaxID=2077276 RepID=A0A9W6WRZ3_9STRA|nr:unnamed protein product [Phytophthora lilii]
MAQPSSAAPPLKTALPWLKRLLDDDDSSDSSQATPQQAARPKPPAKSGEGGERLKKRRRRLEASDEDEEAPAKPAGKRKEGGGKRQKKTRPESTESSSDANEKRRRRLKKPVKERRKRPVDGSKHEQTRDSEKAKSTVEPAKVKAAALREQRKQKLLASRASNGEGGKLAAFKLKRQQSAEALNEKERVRMRAIRAACGARKISVGDEADVEDEGDPRRSRLVSKKGISDKSVVKHKSHKSTVSTKEKIEKEPVEPAAVTTDTASNMVQAEREEQRTPADTVQMRRETERDATPPVTATTTFADPVKSEDDEEEVSIAVAKAIDPKEPRGEVTEHVNEKVTSVKIEKSEDSVKNVEKKIGDKNGSNCADPVKTEDTDDAKLNSTTNGKETPVELTKPIAKEKMPTESNVADESSAEPVRKEDGEDGEVVLPAVANEAEKPVKQEDGGEENIKEGVKQELLLDMMPIPRKTVKKEEPANAESFVIPKRTFPKNITDGPKDLARAVNAGKGDSQTGRLLDPPVSVAMLPVPSPESSPHLSMRELVPPQRKRLKNPVPLKNSNYSAHDRALMRLSRKRNSIFMAAVELADHAVDIRNNRKVPATRMMGYEVYDADRKVLPDLIPRFSCATKREMASKKESYTSSFFGVSLSAPKAKGKIDSDECGDNDVQARKVNCYEELRFERPEDRAFYQRRMYGTAFVPLKLRGWITLIVRNARFERKSTGIRFNQDRDREEFAASLSKRYTFNKSVPRCDIPRENWQKLMRNQPGIVYLHYYNREDAEQASRVFLDDLGKPLELRLEYKAGVVISRSSSPAAGPRFQRTPRRSCSSERSAPERSPQSSQNGSARNTPSWRRERPPRFGNDNRYSRPERGAPPPPPAPWSRGEGRYGPPASGNKRPRALLERRSRSRSRSRQSRTGPGINDRMSTPSVASEAWEKANNVSEIAPGSDSDTPARKRARTVSHISHRSPVGDFERDTSEKISGSTRAGPEDGELDSSVIVASKSEENLNRGGDERREVQRIRSPPRRWQHEPVRKAGQMRDNFSNYPRERPGTDHRPHPQQPSRDSNRRRSSSRSRPSNRGGRGGSPGGRFAKERPNSREFGRSGASYQNSQERRMHPDVERYGGRGGVNRR